MENKKKLFDRLLDAIERGRAGENEGIPIPFSRLSDYIPNIQKKTFYLIGGATKSGKTSFADDVFLYGAYDYYKALKDADLLEGFDLDMDYFSFEIDTETKIAKGISRKLWHDYGIIADAKQILSKGKFYCSDELFGLVRNLRDYFNDFEDVVTIFDRVENPTGIHKYLVSKAEKHGESVYKNINIDPDGDPIYRFSHYKPHNNKRYHLYFVDHLGLTMEERGFSTKQTMDKVSSYSVALRNNYSMTPVIIQQMSFDTTNDDRHKSNRLTPTTRDFGDSRYPSRDANVVMALFSPSSVNMERFQNYDITRLGDSFRNLEILLNRDGEPNINLGLNFIGPCGTFREMPRASEITNDHYEKSAKYINSKSQYVKQNNVWIPNPLIN